MEPNYMLQRFAWSFVATKHAIHRARFPWQDQTRSACISNCSKARALRPATSTARRHSGVQRCLWLRIFGIFAFAMFGRPGVPGLTTCQVSPAYSVYSGRHLLYNICVRAQPDGNIYSVREPRIHKKIYTQVFSPKTTLRPISKLGPPLRSVLF